MLRFKPKNINRMNSKIYILIICSFIFSLNTLHAQKKFVNHLNIKKEFDALQGDPLNNKFGNIESVKVVLDYKTKKIYFINSSFYKYHSMFCIDILHFPGDLGDFNKVSYHEKNNRMYLLANINHIANTNDWFMDLAASDKMNAELINYFFNEVKSSVYFKDNLKFYLSTPRLINLYDEKLLKIPCVFSDYIYKNMSEQSIETGEVIGYFKKYTLKDLEKIRPNKDEIILLNETPEVIPDVRGIIITQFQTPLSHLVILAKNRNIPLYVDTKAWDNEKINALIDKKVVLNVSKSKFTLKVTTATIKPPKKIQLKPLHKNLKHKEIINLNQLPSLDAQQYIGTKALNMALLNNIASTTKKFKTPQYTYAIPFYYYDQHMKKNGINEEVEQLLILPKDSIQLIHKQLKKIRSLIIETPINDTLIEKLSKIINSHNEFSHFRFRSSTNAEDLAGFNGAGLYDSKSAIVNDSIKTISKAIKVVWASIWNDRAYYEREYFHINHKDCAMGILIHRAFVDEIANGVIVSKNLYRVKYDGITVNVQKGEESVVEPKEGILCDEFYCHNFNGRGKDINIDYRSTSNLNNNKPILKATEIKRLFNVTKMAEIRINKLWKQYKMSDKYLDVDIEFKYENNYETLYFKQIRPYMD